jgi:protein-tyrosine phosphatase
VAPVVARVAPVVARVAPVVARVAPPTREPAIIWGVSRWFRSYGFAEVLDELIVGAYPLDNDDVDTLARLGVRRVLNLSEDEEYRAGERQAVERALAGARIAEHRLPVTDYGGLPADRLEAAVTEIARWLGDGQRTYLHCRAGWQRSAAVAAGVVAVRTGRDIDQALAYVQERKPTAEPLAHQRADLRRWWESRRGPDDAGSDVGLSGEEKG